ncbi:MAG: hypothetical protein ACOC9Q_03430 [bacterium]
MGRWRGGVFKGGSVGWHACPAGMFLPTGGAFAATCYRFNGERAATPDEHRKRRKVFNTPYNAPFLTFSCYRRQAFFSVNLTARWFLECRRACLGGRHDTLVSTMPPASASYKSRLDLLTRARLAGLVPMGQVADETRPIETWSTHDDVQDYIADELEILLRTYRRDLLAELDRLWWRSAVPYADQPIAVIRRRRKNWAPSNRYGGAALSADDAP